MSGPSNGNGDSTRRNIASVLITINHVTSPIIAGFLAVHLSAPILANVGGSSLASQTMVLGRELYQTSRGELIVLGGLGIHAFTGIIKRLVLSTPSASRTQGTDGNSGRKLYRQRPFRSLLSLTAYSAFFIFLPVHFGVHRAYPNLPDEPIAMVGPSSLDFEYVKYGLHTWPWRSWFFYGGITLSAMLHVAEGTAVIFNTWFRDWWFNLSRKTIKRIAFWGVAVPVLLGVATVSREQSMVMPFLKDRYHAAFTTCNVFKF